MDNNSPSSSLLASFYSPTSSLSTTTDTGDDEALPEEYRAVRNAVGLVGVPNVGNTCYVSAAMQAASAVLSTWPADASVNVDNAMGARGAWAALWHQMMAYLRGGDDDDNLSMREWMRQLSALNPLYSPTQGQQDAQEFLGWALDLLHEEFNRVTRKPYVEVEGKPSQTDEEVAAAYWSAHCARDQSWVAERCYGQQLQKIRCGACGAESRTAQVFNTLFLGLPTDWLRTMEVVWFGRRHGPLRVAVKVDRNAPLSDVVKALCGVLGDVDSEANVRLVDIHGCRIFSTLDLKQTVKGMRGPIYAYEIAVAAAPAAVPVVAPAPPVPGGLPPPPPPSGPRAITAPVPPPLVHLQLLHRLETTDKPFLFGFPSLLSVDQTKMTKRELLDTLVLPVVQKMALVPDCYSFVVGNVTGLKCGACKNVKCTGCPFVAMEASRCDFVDKQTLVCCWKPIEGCCRLQVPGEFAKHESMVRAELEGEEKITLDECFASSYGGAPSELADAYRCSQCKQEALHSTMTTRVSRWPAQHLLVALKRFPRRDLSDKIEIEVQYPDQWQGMHLVAVVNHIAARSGAGGHYVAYRKVGDAWYKFNDSSVTLLDPKFVVSKNAYLLLYSK